MAHEIGSKIWSKGDEVTIITDPYMMYGGWFQDAEKENGVVVSIVTPEQRNADVKKSQDEWKAQQAQFKKLS